MESGIVVLIVLGVFVLIVAPILAVSAFVRVRKLEAGRRTAAPGEPQTDPRIIARIYALEQSVAKIDGAMAGGTFTPGVPAEATPQTTASAPPVVPPLRTAPPPAPPAAAMAPPMFSATGATISAPISSAPGGKAGRSSLDLETLIAGRWLNYIGILAMLFAVAFFIKYAFDNNWVGPQGRVAIGLMAGAALLPWSDRLLRRGYRYFSEGIAGLGAAVMFLSLWAGWHYYRVFSQAYAFAGMVVVTAAMVAIAIGRNSQRIAILALAGGLLTPLLVSTGKDQQVVLFTFLAVLAAGILAVARARDWPVLAPMMYGATQVYFWGWYSDFYDADKLISTSLFAALFFVIFAALPVIRSRREGRLGVNDQLIVVLNPFLFLLALNQMLWPEHRWILTIAVLALAAFHLLLLRALPASKPGERNALAMLFAGIALTFATLAIPIRLDGKWITMAWAIEGAVLIWSGLRMKTWALRAAGLLLFVIAAVRLCVIPIYADVFLFNPRFAAFAVTVACFLAAMNLARRQWDELGEGERNVFAVLGVAANIFAIAALSLEIWDLFGRMPSIEIDRGLAQQLGLSLLWIVYGAGLLFAGIKRGLRALRWQALVLIGIVVVKVFLFDLSSLARFYRIVSFLVLGLVLLGVSFWYQKKLAANKGEEQQ
jgi:uncharacterized membrane protein